MTGALLTSMVRTGCLQASDMTPLRMVWTCLQLSRGPRTCWICSNPPQAWIHLGWSLAWYWGGSEHNHLQLELLLTPTGALELNSSKQCYIVQKKSWKSKSKSLRTCSRPTQSSGSMSQTTRVRTTCPPRRLPLSGLQYRCPSDPRKRHQTEILFTFRSDSQTRHLSPPPLHHVVETVMVATPSEQSWNPCYCLPLQGLVPEFFLQLHSTGRVQSGFLKHPCLLLRCGLHYHLLAGRQEIFLPSLLRSFLMSLVWGSGWPKLLVLLQERPRRFRLSWQSCCRDWRQQITWLGMPGLQVASQHRLKTNPEQGKHAFSGLGPILVSLLWEQPSATKPVGTNTTWWPLYDVSLSIYSLRISRRNI